MVEEKEEFVTLGVYNLYKGYWSIVDDQTGDDPDELADKAAEEDFKLYEPGSKEWMNFWRLNPSRQSEMIEFRNKLK